MPRLIAQSGHSLDLPVRHLTFGSSPQCDIPLTGVPGLAPLHFEIAPGNDGFSYLRDASAGVGTQVNGQPVTVTMLKEGDVITAGGLQMRFSPTAGTPVPQAPPTPASPAIKSPAPMPAPAASAPAMPSVPAGAPPVAAAAPGKSQPAAQAAPAAVPATPAVVPTAPAVVPKAPATAAAAAVAPASPPPLKSPSPASSPPVLPVAAVAPASSHSVKAAPPTAPAPAALVAAASKTVPKTAPAPVAVGSPPVVQLPGGGETIASSDPPDLPAAAQTAATPSPDTTSQILTSKAQRRRPSSLPSPFAVRVACGILLLIAAAAFFATDPGRRMLDPAIAKIHAWNTARSPKPKLPPPTDSTAAATTQIPAGPTPVIVPQEPHEEISRRLLTERTLTLIYADLRQLIPSYNMMASQQGLPSQREMSDAFRKSYGAVLDPFEKLTLLQADTGDEFLLILTAPKVVELEKVIGQPARPGKDDRTKFRIYPVKAGARSLSAALYDPFTLLLGAPRAVARAAQVDSGPQLREARCMFPETAHRQPGALIMVTRVNLPSASSEAGPAMAFETMVTNLFLTGSIPSALTLTRNPEVSEKAFVDAATPALVQQARELAPALGTEAKALSNISASEINLTLNEASVPLPGGAALISTSLEGLARSLVRAAPSMSTILQAQDAAMHFNSARATGAGAAIKAASSREALDLLNEGIRGGGGAGGAMFKYASAEDQIENLSSLLAIDNAVGLVYRPDTEILSGASLDLALKARNYRNAELILQLWEKAGLKPADDEAPASAAKRVLEWAGTPEGRPQRRIMPLPDLTNEEFQGAVSHLAIADRRLCWKPGEANYRAWVRLAHPDPHRDAGRLAAVFNAAVAGGAIPASATRDLGAAITLITRGAAGRGEHSGTVYKLDTLTPAEVTAASALLSLEDGKMVVNATPAGKAVEMPSAVKR